MIEAPLDLQKQLTIPDDQLQVCRDQNIATAGNAAGRTDDLLNLQGANRSPKPLPAGFTAKGIIALVFSCVSAFLGMAVISWYVTPRCNVLVPRPRGMDAPLLIRARFLSRYGASEIGKQVPTKQQTEKWGITDRSGL